jgi:hypothetical protein
MSNLASIYLNAGLVEQARTQLLRAQEQEDVNNRVLTVFGEMAAKENAENEAVTELGVCVEHLTRWRLVEAETLVAPAPLLESLVGLYLGRPLEAVVTIDHAGNVSGSFPYGMGRVARISGRLDSGIARFTWTTANADDTSFFSLLGHSKGYGLLFHRNGVLEGFTVEGDSGLDAVKRTGWLDWSVSRLQQLNQAPLRIAPPSV